MLAKDSSRLERTFVNRTMNAGNRPKQITVIDRFTVDHLGAASSLYPPVGQNLFAARPATSKQEKTKTTVVAESRRQPAAADFKAVGRFQPPRRIGLHPTLCPNPVGEILGNRFSHRGA